MLERHVIVGSKHIKPIQQGSLSRMCGVYSVLNAIQLCIYPRRLSSIELQRLYRHAIQYLSRRRQLPRVLGIGMAYQLWIELCDELMEQVAATYDVRLMATRTLHGSAATDRQRAVRQIKRSLRRGHPVLTLLGGTLDHYTVFSGYTAERLLLFDSSGLRWVHVDNVGLGERGSRTHWLLPSLTSTIAEQW